MDAKNGFFAESVEEGLERIRKETGRRVADTGFRGKRKDTRHFVTDDGRGFLCMRMSGRLFFMGKKLVTGRGKPVTGTRDVRYFAIKEGRKLRYVRVAKCVYCAFVLGRWDEDCEVAVKDGDEGHLEPGNLAAKEGAAGVSSGEALALHAEVYRKEFRRIVRMLGFRFNFRMALCEDIVQDAFLYACGMEDHKGDFTAFWVWNAQQRCKMILRYPEEEWDERLAAAPDTPFEYPMGLFLNHQPYYEVWDTLRAGWTDEEAMERLGLGRNQYHLRKDRMRRMLKKCLNNDIYFMNHVCEIV